MSAREGEIREFEKQRLLLLQGKRHFKIALRSKLGVLLLFYVGHVVRNGRSVLSLDWNELYSRRGTEGKIFCCGSRCSPNLKFEIFASSFGSKIVPEIVQHVQYDYFFVIRPIISLICDAAVAVLVS